MTPQQNSGPFLVTDSHVPVLERHSLANDIIARLERDLALANPNRAHLSYLPKSFYEPHPDTPIVVLRRVLNTLYSFAFNA